MITALLLASRLAAGPAEAAPPASGALALSGFVSAWRQDCSGECGLPAPAGKGEAVAAAIDVPLNPGEARTAKFSRDFAYAGSGEKVRAAVTIYFVCPRDGAPGAAGDTCPSHYLQVQVVLTGDARAFCAAALNVDDARPFPVIMCAGENARKPGERLGVSLSRKELSAAAALAR